jgi:hypothetical protein
VEEVDTDLEARRAGRAVEGEQPDSEVAQRRAGRPHGPMNSVLPCDNTIWLRMTKDGFTYTTSYLLDGSTWVP